MAKKKMISKIKYNYSDYGRGSDIELEVDLSRFERQYEKAQFDLDNLVMTSMVPYMPMRDGVFINVTRAMSESLAGTGTVVAAAPPFGRFLYEGNVMVGEQSRSAWAKKGERKEVIDKKLKYSTGQHSKVTDHWFDKAKKEHLDEWLKKTKKKSGGG